ncbi:C40 family peptidase [Thauera linaloolentis]|uniref:NLP/P60 protein n=1 Tax=Thauera linaloolentis (strain DSM 12138 / JCM 21573 / CCUG 41526 / CIP 105981 / IAM 15112 / NBRC 102519 / 47Lol) TaxID=1123367 RepID=N6Z8N9_THAL4|nr:C40 family peptidase [Thauera linaloolentis]ENO88519.1 NLP/P60 protein [Thauera linaloolentis 47Lol = DSM 12138]MCM8564904.1 C40 family peptidase [Thauera linaloolentis]
MQIRPFLLALTLAFSGAQTAFAKEPARQVAVEPELSAIDDYGSAAEQLVDQALEYLGVRYRFGGTSPETGLDCSGLVLNVFRNAIGFDLPRTAAEMSRMGDKIGRQDLKPGDLVFFNTMRRTFSHVGIYLGDGKFVHAPSSGGRVRIEAISSSYWSKRFNGARRLVDDSSDTATDGLGIIR